MISQKTKVLFLPIILLMAACGGKQNSSTSTDRDTIGQTQSDKENDSTHIKYNHLISNIPIPFDILNRLSNSYITYKADLLNPDDAVDSYNQTASRSLNLGVYGADLTYVISLGEFREFAPHIRVIKKLSDELGVPAAFDDDVMARYNNNKENKDTLQKIIYHSYNEIDKTLKANDRLGMAALVVCGGWVESLYLTTQTIGEHGNDGSYAELYALVYDQKQHLGNLINLMNDFKTEPFLNIETQLKEVQKTYAQAAMDKRLSPEEVRAISSLVTKLRNQIIQPN